MPNPLTLKIGVAGVRGVVGGSLTPQLVSSFAAAFGSLSDPGAIAVGADTRPSREMMLNAVMAGLMSVGCQPIDLGIVPGPALQLYVRQTGAVGGIGITASHNPIEWNALKFFGPDGALLRPGQAADLTDLYHQGGIPRVAAEDVPSAACDDAAIERHREAVLAAVDVEGIRARRLRVAIDCCNGAASVASPTFLRRLGCEVIEVSTDVGAPFPRDPEPLRANLGDLRRAVRECGADIGFAQDADADRLAVVSELGEPIGEDWTLPIAARHWLKSHPGPVVASGSTTHALDQVARECGCALYRCPTGETHVLERMAAVGATIGGEGNGGVVVPAISPCRDSFVGMALVLEALVPPHASVTALRAELPQLSIVRVSVPFAARTVAGALRQFERAHPGAATDRTDGLKVLLGDRWVQVRGSNTEAVLRVTAEAPTEADAQALADEAVCLLTG